MPEPVSLKRPTTSYPARPAKCDFMLHYSIRTPTAPSQVVIASGSVAALPSLKMSPASLIAPANSSLGALRGSHRLAEISGGPLLGYGRFRPKRTCAGSARNARRHHAIGRTAPGYRLARWPARSNVRPLALRSERNVASTGSDRYRRLPLLRSSASAWRPAPCRHGSARGCKPPVCRQSASRPGA